ncbi:hypothetical protein EYF80_000578 [Liparis tanakae]|uniref:Uncharacterized protein n=1 Tax=Liparis tanakae TaxID=230148 RepID=A0A4Z2JGL0_9TELE|nr:hypothetical protein EYF80_000578 [Liparis tanakae]
MLPTVTLLELEPELELLSLGGLALSARSASSAFRSIVESRGAAQASLRNLGGEDDSIEGPFEMLNMWFPQVSLALGAPEAGAEAPLPFC